MSRSKTPFDKHLGAVIRVKRLAAGKSQTEIAHILGVSFQNIQKKERGINRLCVEDLVLLSDALGATPQQLIDAACEADAPQTGPRIEQMSDRVTLETVRLLAGLSPERQRIARNVVKAFAGEEAA